MRPNWVEIDLDIFDENIRNIRSYLNIQGGRQAKIAAVVKADGYGHGAEMLARSALECGADILAVAVLEEAVALRDCGIDAPILVLGWTPVDAIEEAIKRDISLTAVSYEHGRAVACCAERIGTEASIHLKVETGMGRLGVPCNDEGIEQAEHLFGLSGIQIEGAFTHFAVADEDQAITREQIRRFRSFLINLKRNGMDVPTVHAANSAGILDYPEAIFDMVRPGLMLYGVYPSHMTSRSIVVRPFLAWKTRIAQIKTVPAGEGISYGHTYVTSEPTTIATLPVGYADGYPRGLSNIGEVLIDGRRCRIAGRICMDQTMIVIPEDFKGVEPGMEVTLLGRQANDEIHVEELADAMNTIAHEIFTGISRRVPRVYKRAEKEIQKTGILQF